MTRRRHLGEVDCLSWLSSRLGFDASLSLGMNAKYYEQRGTAVLNQIKEENLDKVRRLFTP